ncbi:MAG: hypothetical protein ACYTEQ_10565 [Planctomycetota bacterium]|jgi:hypothetical protein
MNKPIWKIAAVIGLIHASTSASIPSRIWYESAELPLFRKVKLHGRQEVPIGAEKPELKFLRDGMYNRLQSPGVSNFVIDEIISPKRKIRHFIRSGMYYGERSDESLNPFNGFQHADSIILTSKHINRIQESPSPKTLTYFHTISDYTWKDKKIVGVRHRIQRARYTAKGRLAATSKWKELDLVQGNFVLTLPEKCLPPSGKSFYVATFYRAPGMFRQALARGKPVRRGYVMDQHLVMTGNKINVLLRYPRNDPRVTVVLEMGPPWESDKNPPTTTPITELEVIGADVIHSTLHLDVSDEQIRQATSLSKPGAAPNQQE